MKTQEERHAEALEVVNQLVAEIQAGKFAKHHEEVQVQEQKPVRVEEPKNQNCGMLTFSINPEFDYHKAAKIELHYGHNLEAMPEHTREHLSGYLLTESEKTTMTGIQRLREKESNLARAVGGLVKYAHNTTLDDSKKALRYVEYDDTTAKAAIIDTIYADCQGLIIEEYITLRERLYFQQGKDIFRLTQLTAADDRKAGVKLAEVCATLDKDEKDLISIVITRYYEDICEILE